MPKLQERYESKEAAMNAFEALLIDADGDEGGVTLHDDVIRQFKVVNDTTGSLSGARKAEREAKAALKKFQDALELHDIDASEFETALEELTDLRAQKDQFEAGDNKDEIEKIVSKRVEAAEARFNREKAKLEKQLSEKDEALGVTTGRLSEMTLDRALSEHADKLGIKAHSMKFIKRLGKDEFGLNEDGEIIDKTDAGRSLEDWLEGEISENPFLTADLKNGGMDTTNNGSGAGKRTYKREDFNSLPPEDQMEVALKANKGEAAIVD